MRFGATDVTIADNLTTDRPSFRTIAASRRDGWRPAHDPRNWPDDPEMIPRDVVLLTDPEMLGRHNGKGVCYWNAEGGAARQIHHRPFTPVDIRPSPPRPKALDLSEYETFGQRIAALRVWRGRVSQNQLARIAGVHHTHLSRIERDQATPSFHTVLRIADALRVTPGTLLDGGLVA